MRVCPFENAEVIFMPGGGRDRVYISGVDTSVITPRDILDFVCMDYDSYCHRFHVNGIFISLEQFNVPMNKIEDAENGKYVIGFLQKWEE